MLLHPLLENAQNLAGETAIVDDRGILTFSQLAHLSGALAMYLNFRTQKPRVGLFLPSSGGFAVSFFATLFAGKTIVPINFLLSEREIGHIIADSEIDTVLTAPPLASKLAGSKLNVIDLTQLPPSGATALPSLPAVKDDDIAVLLYTSGTSGLPKGVQVSYGNLESDVRAAIQHAQLKGSHSFLGVLPLFHSTGLLATLIAPMTLGAKVVYQARFSPAGMVQAIKQHSISIVAAVPSMYGAMLRLKEANPDDMKSLYAAISGGEPLPSNIREGFEAKFGQPIYEGYGLTETIGPIAFNAPGSRKAGSVGKLIPGAEVKIVDDELWLRGPMIMKGYFKLPAETAEAITPDGYFKTGDLGRIDEDGYLHITGRKKELIIIAGEKVSPRQVEEAIAQYESVGEVAVIGRSDSSRGEAVVAFIIPKPQTEIRPEQIRDHCRTIGMPGWQIPKDIFIVQDLPRSPTGKVLKRVLKEKLQANA
ncbi:MAG TPA: AMP-binding protein [Tepidisphaeraceae bacterium]|jgi:long-chain acyl-CoA synthetase